jgi:hypothetical protein
MSSIHLLPDWDGSERVTQVTTDLGPGQSTAVDHNLLQTSRYDREVLKDCERTATGLRALPGVQSSGESHDGDPSKRATLQDFLPRTYAFYKQKDVCDIFFRYRIGNASARSACTR